MLFSVLEAVADPCLGYGIKLGLRAVLGAVQMAAPISPILACVPILSIDIRRTIVVSRQPS